MSEAAFNPTTEFPYCDSYFGSQMIVKIKNSIRITSNRQGDTTPATLYVGI